LFVYTDGVVESMNHNNEEFGSERFISWLTQLAEAKSEKFVQMAVAALDKHQGSALQHDDITLVSVRFSG